MTGCGCDRQAERDLVVAYLDAMAARIVRTVGATGYFEGLVIQLERVAQAIRDGEHHRVDGAS